MLDWLIYSLALQWVSINVSPEWTVQEDISWFKGKWRGRKIGLLNHKNNPDIMLLVAWALTHLVDILPSSCVALLHYGAVLCSLARLLTIEYMDLAEQALKKICQVHPSAFFRAGTLVAVLSYLDFFSARVQVEEFLS
ncbi:hypothetical protein T459_01104 [Capsicum annuum]|uniref:HECT-type E3 ubiquitin transferase n=1 Tax=Capsicum annuum TaxID=4072 RepID=A0A2G3AG54_CAPAN|nr:hypothetical protein T459_01104 [Capsicum annuum]